MQNKLLPTMLLLLGAAMQSDAQIVVNGITEKILDIRPGTAEGGVPMYLYNFNNHIYFSAVTNATGRELWQTDGTATGTAMLKDINAGSTNSDPMFFKPMGGKLYFFANGLWETDGTISGTQQVKNVGTFYNLFPYNSSFLFGGYGTNGNELWISDGTNAGTQELIDLNPGISDGYPTSLTSLGSNVVFAAFGDATMATYTPWITDGTASGTQQLSTVNVYADAPNEYDKNGKEGSDFCEYNGEVYFGGSDGVTGFELWKTDGTPSGTVMVKDITTTPGGSLPQWFRVYNGKLYFSVDIGDPAVDGLWVTSGTDASTVRLKAGIRMGDGEVVEYAEINGTLYFIASGKLWETNGTVSGTHAVLNSPDDPHRLTTLNNKLFFFATANTAPVQFTLFGVDNFGNPFPASMPMSSLLLPYLHTDTMGNCIYFAAAPEATPGDIELYRFKDTTFEVGVNNVQSLAVNSIYPNPATNSFSVQVPDSKHTNVYVYSLNGQLLLQSEKTDNIDIAKLTAGIYTVQIISDGAVSVGKLRKE